MAESALTPLLAREPLAAELVVMMEPTDNAIHAGCLGNINATWTFTGRAGHSARPWDGDNAIHKAARGIAALAEHEPEEHDFGGLKFYEVVSATMIEGGIATNVVPDRATAQVNYRYAPGRSPRGGRGAAARADRRPRRDRGHLELPERAGAARQPARRAPAAGLQIAPKQAWTPVAEFGRGGLDAVNFGPGEPAQAHRARRVGADRRPRARLPRAGGVRGVKLSPTLAGLRTYPFVRLTEAKRRLAAAGVDFVDFGMGEPREETPAFIREALAAAIEPLSSYPAGRRPAGAARGDRRLGRRRFGVTLDPDREIVPTLGSKEAIFHLAQVAGGELVAAPTPAYPVYERGAAFAGRALLELPLAAERRLPARPRRGRAAPGRASACCG